MQGGSFNRIIGLSIVESNGEQESEKSVKLQYILRIPRFKDARLDSDMAILRVASRYAEIKVPETVFFDLSTNNFLEKPYTIQHRIPGRRLHDTYHSLSHHQKCALAQELGQVFQKFLLCGNDSASTLVPADESLLYHTVSTRFPGVKASLRPFGKDDAQDEMKDFLDATSAMETLFSRFDNHYCLCHLDLAPRNILIDENALESPIITGVLDLDIAVFGPSFLACGPPTWLWAWDDGGTSTSTGAEDERLLNDPLPTEEQRQIKQVFDDAAGTYYCQLAYTAEFRLARKLCHFAMTRIDSTWVTREAGALLKEIHDARNNEGSILTPSPPWTESLCEDCRQRHALSGQTRCMDCLIKAFHAERAGAQDQST
ncbi:MAG: hypothetical protein Q9160_007484 [Pyrenula sp. 1 TL-2023]